MSDELVCFALFLRRREEISTRWPGFGSAVYIPFCASERGWMDAGWKGTHMM